MPTRFPTLRRSALLLTVIAACLPLAAQSLPRPPASPPPFPPSGLPTKPPPPPPDLPSPSELLNQLRQLEELLSLSPDQIERLSKTIQYIRNMDSNEREAMRIRIRQITQLTPEIEAEIQQFARLLPPDQRSNLSQFWLVADEAKRSALRDQLTTLPQDQQAAILLQAVQEFVHQRDRVFESMAPNATPLPPSAPR